MTATDDDEDDLYCRESWRQAMRHAALFWPGVTISDGAFDVLRQVAEYRAKNKRNGVPIR